MSEGIYSKIPHVVYETLRENKNIKERDLHIAFLSAIQNADVKLVSYFLTYGIDLIKAKRYIFGNKTVLLKSMDNPNIDIIRLLIARPDSEIEFEASNGNILTYAIKQHNHEVCKLILLTGKIKSDYVNSEGESLLDIAKEYLNDNITNLIANKPFSSEYSLIGSGIEGYIIFPAFDHSEKFVSKLSRNNNDDLIHEYDIYKRLPKDGPYVNPDDVQLYEIDSSGKYQASELCEFNCTKHLVLPKFEGVVLYDITRKYGVTTDDNNAFFTLCEYITFDDWIKLARALSKFNILMGILKSDYKFTHGDLNLNNMVYINNKETNDGEILMYDFGFSFFGNTQYKVESAENDDEHLKRLNIIILLIGIRNPEISKYLIEYDTIDDDSVNLIHNLKCEIDHKNIPFFGATQLPLKLLSYKFENFKSLIVGLL